MNLLLLSSSECAPDGRAVVRDARARHVREVLRGAPGQALRIGLLDGPLGRGTIESVGPGGVTLRCHFDGGPPARPPVDLLMALPRPKVMKRLWAPLAALGAGRILLTNAARVERMYFDTHVLNPAFRTERLVEGLAQARDTRLPEVTVHRRFKVLLEDGLAGYGPETLRLAADPRAAGRVGPAVTAAAPHRVLLAVGPEGGWSDHERGLLADHGFRAVGLGPRALRTDTACLVLLGLVHDALAASGNKRHPAAEGPA